jgi:hypothetical protein
MLCPMPSLPELMRSLEAHLDAIHAEGARVVALRLDGMSQRATLQLAEAASDVVATGRVLAQAHRVAIRAFRSNASPGRPLPANSGERTLLAQPTELAALSVSYKTWLFFVRAFCDHAYRLLLADAESRLARRGGSMSAVLNPLNPVAEMFAASAPDLPDWFRAFRELRNEMKDGAAFAFSELDARGLALTIFQITARRDSDPAFDVVEGRAMRLSDVVEDARRIREVLAALDANRV